MKNITQEEIEFIIKEIGGEDALRKKENDVAQKTLDVVFKIVHELLEEEQKKANNLNDAVQSIRSTGSWNTLLLLLNIIKKFNKILCTEGFDTFIKDGNKII